MPLSKYPGGFERQCLRRINHSYLFDAVISDANAELAQAIQRDKAYTELFLQQFESALTQAVKLKPKEETEVVLQLKAELDRLYTASVSAAGDQQETRTAIDHLIQLLMDTIRQAAGSDTLANKELQEEAEARSAHFQLLECDLLGDILNSHTDTGEFVPATELVPTLLSVEKSVLAGAVKLFDLNQARSLIDEAQALLEGVEAGGRDDQLNAQIESAMENLMFIQGYRVYLEDYTREL